jgi:hypothetical protein
MLNFAVLALNLLGHGVLCFLYIDGSNLLKTLKEFCLYFLLYWSVDLKILFIRESSNIYKCRLHNKLHPMSPIYYSVF